MSRGNGGQIGVYTNTTSLLAPGCWGLNSVAQRLSRITTAGPYDNWPQLSDASFSSVVGLYHFDSVVGGLFPDSSSKGLNLTPVTVTNDCNLNSLGKFGPYALNCTGASGAVRATNTNYNFSTNDFTIEGWWYILTLAVKAMIDLRSGTGTQFAPQLYFDTNASIRYFSNGADRITSANSIFSTSTWFHLAACRVSNTTRMFVNGTQVGSNYSDANTYAQGALTIGLASNLGTQMVGIADEVRITNGVGRYSGNFTAPTVPFPDS